jgi:homoserine O-acetyltransferase
VVVAGIDTDRLYPLELQRELVEAIPNAQELNLVESNFGHDAFLIEIDAIAPLITKTLARTSGALTPH